MPNVIPDNSRYHGSVNAERIRQIRRMFHYDSDNLLHGGYGALYLRTPQGLKKFEYFKTVPAYWRSSSQLGGG